MRVVCDQCAATYRVPNARLNKPINKATCRTCGARLLIPMPPSGADDEERVVVPAVPATAPVGDSGVVSPGIEDDDDKTVPIVDRRPPPMRFPPEDDVQLIAGAPIGRNEREVIQKARSQPVIVPVRGNQAPAPAPEPQNGLGLSFAGMAVALAGGLILFIASSPPMTFLGLFLFFGGALTAMMVLAFSGFGKQSGKPGLSLGLGMGSGVVIAALLTMLRTLTAPAGGPTPLPVTPPVAAPAAPAAAATPAPAAPATPLPAADPAAPPTPVAAEPPKPVSNDPADRARERELERELERARERERELAREAERAGREPVAAAEPAPKPEPAPPPKPEPAPPPKPEPAAAPVPPAVIDTIIKNNVNVKRCFYESLKSGEIVKPVSVRVSFFLSSSGRASNVRITSPSANSGGPLNRCLDGSFQTLTFPPSSESKTVSYTFNL